jgi:peptidyl-prolyl cis-trans isomerase SurA
MKTSKIILINLLIIFFFYNTASSAIKNKIIVKVGNEIVTSIELENKIKITLILSNTDINQENINKIKNFSLKSLIDLKLKNQELEKYNLTINPKAITEHLNKVALGIGVAETQLREFFERNNVNFDQYVEELTTEFLWQKLMFNIYSKNIVVDEDQIKNELNTIINLNKTQMNLEFNLAEIEVFIENIIEKSEVTKNIKKQIDELGFKNTAINLSNSSTAVDGGDLGWVNVNSLSPDVLKLIKDLKIGDISEPLFKFNKIIFFKLIDKRSVNNEKVLNENNLKKKLTDNKKSELLSLYSISHLSKIKNLTLIEY